MAESRLPPSIRDRIEELKLRRYFPERRRAIRLRRSELTRIKEPGYLDFKLATEREELEAAWRLLHDVYVEQGYMRPHPSGLRLIVHNLLPQTTVFIARRRQAVRNGGEVIGTITLFVDSPLGLPMDEVFHEELEGLRRQGRRISEVGALALKREHRNRNVFMYLFKIAHAYARYLGMHDLCIAIHPKHRSFYEEVLLFEPFGHQVRPYGKVNGSPAVAERLDLTTAEQRARQVYEPLEFDANLHAFFYAAEQGYPFATEERRKVLTPELLRYFFVERTDLLPRLDERTLEVVRRCYPGYDFGAILNGHRGFGGPAPRCAGSPSG